MLYRAKICFCDGPQFQDLMPKIIPASRKLLSFKIQYFKGQGQVVAQWLRHCATNWKVAGSIPEGVIGIFDIILEATLWPWG
jgi:hypothetical protein